MKERILITGMSGVGKTSVGEYLQNLGYESTDIEEIGGMFTMVHQGTKIEFENYDNANPEHIKGAEWICSVEKLENFLSSQKSDVAFYTGIASNMDDILPLFTKVIVLQPSAVVLNERLKNREGTEDIGNTQGGRDVILGWKDWWENEMKKKNAILIDANGSVEKVGQKILDAIKE